MFQSTKLLQNVPFFEGQKGQKLRQFIWGQKLFQWKRYNHNKKKNYIYTKLYVNLNV